MVKKSKKKGKKKFEVLFFCLRFLTCYATLPMTKMSKQYCIAVGDEHMITSCVSRCYHEFIINNLSILCKLLQKPYIVFKEEADVVDFKFEHCHTFNTQPKGIAAVFF